MRVAASNEQPPVLYLLREGEKEGEGCLPCRMMSKADLVIREKALWGESGALRFATDAFRGRTQA